MKIFFEVFSLEICASENFSSENVSSENFSSENFSSENFSSENFSLENFSLENFSLENFSSENFSLENFSLENFSSENLCFGKSLLRKIFASLPPIPFPFPLFLLPSSLPPPPPCSSLELPLSSDLAPRDPPPGPRHLVGRTNRPMENASKKAKGVSGSGSSPKKLLPGPYSSKHVQHFRNFDGLQDGRQGDVVISLHTFEGLVLGCIDADFCK